MTITTKKNKLLNSIFILDVTVFIKVTDAKDPHLQRGSLSESQAVRHPRVEDSGSQGQGPRRLHSASIAFRVLSTLLVPWLKGAVGFEGSAPDADSP